MITNFAERVPVRMRVFVDKNLELRFLAYFVMRSRKRLGTNFDFDRDFWSVNQFMT